MLRSAHFSGPTFGSGLFHLLRISLQPFFIYPRCWLTLPCLKKVAVLLLNIFITFPYTVGVASPTLRDLALQSIGFDDMSGLLAVFHLRISPFDRLVLVNVNVRGHPGLLLPPSGDPGIPSKQIPVKTLIIQIMPTPFSPGPVWLAPSLCPFNFSGLESLSLSGLPEARITNLLHSIQPTLHKLNIDASMIIYAHSDPSANVHIETSVFEASIMQGDPLDEKPLQRLDVLLAGLDAPALRSVWVRISRIQARGTSQIELRDSRRSGRWDRA
ncbi:hypothetical protein B0H16DRAFT_1717340 [Mycena metata]|uniref:Uncharacterized protein n=1 Tax=Mycena metata TaxID=1033252 RepID=A0AAD7NLN0_9AGAR|nr:hypothetical protein B0H16DRAFT_1717340 [Mycena metata]